ncbi:MAG: FeoA family protein [Candidatus Izemoplasmataceae bacterium]
MNITDLEKMETAEVISFDGLDPVFVRRLMDLGIYQSARITVLNKLSFDRLFLLEVDNVEICIRRDDAEKIEVRK